MVLAHKASRPGLDELQTRLDAWTEAHEAAEAARLRAQQEAMAGDGWTVVTRTKARRAWGACWTREGTRRTALCGFALGCRRA